MAEAAIYAALQGIGDAMTSEIVKRAFSQSCIIGSSNLEASMNNITRELWLMQEFIDCTNIHDPSNTDKVTWVNEVRKLANRIEDTIAELVYHISNKKLGGNSFYVRKFFTDPKSLLALIRVASQLQEAEKSMKLLGEMKERWVSPTSTARINGNSSLSNEHSHNMITASAHFIDEDNIVGMEENIAKVTNLLNYEEKKLSVIAVWGMGGIGKTTLVTIVFNRERQKFDCNAWITISQSSTVDIVLRSLILETCKNGNFDPPVDITNKSIRELKEDACNLLQNKKYLIVLDDIWDPVAFQDIRDVLVVGHLGSQIIITSRDLQVAFLAPENKRLELKELPGKESWDLFCTTAFQNETNHECPSYLIKWARVIVAKCDGLPLALVSLGNMLSLFEKTELEWKRVHDQLWELDNNTNMNRLKSILTISFTYLPRHLKNCFLYCSLFPEDFLLARKKLIRLWIAEGFIERRGKSTLEEVAEGYLKELIYRNMLQVIEKNFFGRVKRCCMHDIMRELAISLCTKENFGKLYNDNKHVSINTSVRQISIIKQGNELKTDVSLPLLRNLLFFDATVPASPYLSMIFEKSRYIVVLDFQGLQIQTIPNAIGDLFNLHYLGLRKTLVKVLPKSIKKLHNLQTLDLYLTNIKKLPNGIVELKKLRHLFAEVEVDPEFRSFQSRIGICLSKGVFHLKELQTIQAVESNDMVVKELGNLTQLRSLRILNVKESQSTDLCKSLSKINSFSYLSINASNENEFLHLEDLRLPQIQKLRLVGRLKEKMLQPSLFQISGEGIQSIWLRWSRLQNDPLPSLSHCKNLAELGLQRAYEGQQLTFQAGWFPKLKKLELVQMPNLVQLEMKEGTMESLEEFYLLDMQKLEGIPKSVEHLASLKLLCCRYMPAEFGGLAKGIHPLFHFICRVD